MALMCSLLLFILVAAFGFIDAYIPAGYIPIGNNTNSYYKYHTEEMQWSDASITCQREGAFLFYPETASELEEVIRVFSITSHYISIGISESVIEGVYKTVHGRPISEVTYYSKWKAGDPRVHTNNNYVLLKVEPRELRCYNGGVIPFVCKFQQPVDALMIKSAEEIKTVIANSSERVVEAIQAQSDQLANQATAEKQRQAAAAYTQLDLLQKLSVNQTALLETLANSALKQSLVLDRLAESVGLLLQAARNQTTLMDRQARALEKLQDDDKIDARSEQ